MSTQRADSVELETAITADSFAPSGSVAANIPPELFENILTYVGNEGRLNNDDIFDTTSLEHVSAVAARRGEMSHLSACALTCVFWAQLTRERMFPLLTLRSSDDMSSLLSFLRAPQSPRIPTICNIIQVLHAYYTLGDPPWFHNLAGLWARYQVSHLTQVNLHITGPARPAFVAASARGSILHPLFFATPRALPVVLSKGCDLFLDIKNIHLPNPAVLFNLLQDCLSLRPHCVDCTNLTWNLDSIPQATPGPGPSSVGLKYACRTVDGYWNKVSGCTDDVLVAAMAQSVPHHEFFQQGQGSYLSPLETSFLFDIMRITWCVSSPELQRTKTFSIWSDSDSDPIQENIVVGPPEGTDFNLRWKVDYFKFRCIAARLPHVPAASNNVRIITYIIIDLSNFDNHYQLRRYMKRAYIDWDTFIHTARQFPLLRQVAIQGDRRFVLSTTPTRSILVEFLAHLGGAWFGLGELLGLYHDHEEQNGHYRWAQLQLDTTIMDEIEQRRAEINAKADAEKAASRKLESDVVEETSFTHTGNE